MLSVYVVVMDAHASVICCLQEKAGEGCVTDQRSTRWWWRRLTAQGSRRSGLSMHPPRACILSGQPGSSHFSSLAHCSGPNTSGQGLATAKSVTLAAKRQLLADSNAAYVISALLHRLILLPDSWHSTQRFCYPPSAAPIGTQLLSSCISQSDPAVARRRACQEVAASRAGQQQQQLPQPDLQQHTPKAACKLPASNRQAVGIACSTRGA